MVMGLNLGRDKLSFIFAKIYFWHECERPKTLAVLWGIWKGWEKPSSNDYQCIFVLLAIKHN